MANTKVKAEQLEAAQTNITSLGTLTALTVDDITIDGSTISDGGDLTIDVAGDINLDADGGDINFKDGGTTYGFASKYNNDLWLGNSISDGDVTIRGNDGGSSISALTFDMSAGGNATFAGNVIGSDNLYLTTNTSDGSDNKYVGLDSGGGAGSTSRGAFLGVYGNEHSSLAGDVYVMAGASGSIKLNTGSGPTERIRITSGGVVLVGGVTNTAGGYTFKVGGSDNQGELALFSNATASDLLSYDRTNSHYLTLNIHAGNTNFTQGEVGIKSTTPSDTSWGAAGTNAELAIGNTSSGSAYGVLHLLGHATQATRFSIGAGAGKLYMAYDDVNSAHRIVVDASGNVGIGTSSPGAALHVYAATGDVGITIEAAEDSGSKEPFLNLKSYATNANPVINFGDHAGYNGSIEYENQDDSMSFATNGGKRVFITSGGHMLVGSATTSHTDEVKNIVYASGGMSNVYNMSSTNEWWIMNNLASNSGYTTKIDFRTQDTSRGYIGITGSTVQYYGNSDYRLKENYKYDFDAISLIKAMKPLQFTWKDEPMRGTQTGFLAHELKEVCPYVVEGEKDAMREDDESLIRPQVVDQGKLVAVLTKALQEAITRIEALEAK